eukprot:TRINITY_DN9041_c0_g1_i5.p1 TRINITY_DN9041_c0_g1~~TRINITY_DN9041_c0_g1_i5.p1  ORF type:complete len:309 (-),score=32.85 TRINITY_DN9041_c0_g1_i5:110-1036(-)
MYLQLYNTQLVYSKQRSFRQPGKRNSSTYVGKLVSKHSLQQNDNEPSGELKRNSGPQLKPSDPVETIAWGGTLPPTRRLVISGLSATSIALAANFGGITSGLLSLDGGNFAGNLKLDVLIPVNGFKRCVDYTYGFEFVYPYSWLADQTIARRGASRLEERYSLDLPSLRAKSRREVAEPQVAFGPMGSSGEENVSVIVAPINSSFTLNNLGNPQESAERFLTFIAPEGSGRVATLKSSSSKEDEFGILYYNYEYTIQGPKFYRHNLSTIVSFGGNLYTFNIQCPEELYDQEKQKLVRAAQSFRLMQMT